MIRLLVGRILGGVLLVLVLTLLTYVVFFRVPEDPAGYIAPDALPAERAKIRHELGLDDPLLQQWGRFAWRLATEADLGEELIAPQFGGGRERVNDVLLDRLPTTLSLVAGGFVLMLLLAIPLGLLSALRARSLVDRGILLFTILGIALHPFLVGLLLRNVFSFRLGVAPFGGYCPLRPEESAPPPLFPGSPAPEVCGGVVDWMHHLWLPWMTFALFFLPIYARMVRARVLDNLGQQYVLTARAKGASERRIVTRHVARNAFGPIVAMLAVDVAIVVTAAIYVETVFGLPGIGELVASNLAGEAGYDLHVLVGVVVVVAFAITAVNIVSDLTLRALDPRMRVDAAR
jgi:peptide/nickel transport system permease protein